MKKIDLGYSIQNKNLWIFSSIAILILYLSPLFHDIFYVPIFDNLDSFVAFNKFFAHSGLIFADNNVTIPQMMNGLPRASYGSEYSVMLWLFYFFTPKTAYVINEITVHIVAFVSMFLLLERYFYDEASKYSYLAITTSSLYFATMPLFAVEGITIASVPLVTLSLLKIKDSEDKMIDWIILILVPFYSSFVFFYFFYMLYASMYFIYLTLKTKMINKRLLLAISIFTIMFIFVEYRLFLSTFFDKSFISHRVEFDIFFKNSFIDAYRKATVFLLYGHPDHLAGLQSYLVLPIIIISMFLGLSKRSFSKNESITIWLIIISSLTIGTWTSLLTQIYTLPILTSYILIIYLLDQNNRLYSLLFLLQIVLSIYIGIIFAKDMYWVTDIFPFLKQFNITRLTFIQPIIWTILLLKSFTTLNSKLKYTPFFIVLFLIAQTSIAIDKSNFQTEAKEKYASFKQYYAPKLFEKVKKAIPGKIEEARVVSYGLEPAVTLYNNFYTIDGYSTNYSLSYKNKFRDIMSNYLNNNPDNTYDKWGSKVHIYSIPNTLRIYEKGVFVQRPNFNIDALCSLHTDYIISSRKINITTKPRLRYIDFFRGEKDSWDIVLYKINCD